MEAKQNKRVIKFRAWDGQHMYFNHSVCLQIDGTVSFCRRDGEWVDDSGIELMQFTGLTDKNGVEIYEGDVLENESDASIIARWSNEWGCWDAGFADDPEHSFGLLSQALKDGRGTYTITGNIYQISPSK